MKVSIRKIVKDEKLYIIISENLFNNKWLYYISIKTQFSLKSEKINLFKSSFFKKIF